jgi:hypothetical protein
MNSMVPSLSFFFLKRLSFPSSRIYGSTPISVASACLHMRRIHSDVHLRRIRSSEESRTLAQGRISSTTLSSGRSPLRSISLLTIGQLKRKRMLG